MGKEIQKIVRSDGNLVIDARLKNADDAHKVKNLYSAPGIDVWEANVDVLSNIKKTSAKFSHPDQFNQMDHSYYLVTFPEEETQSNTTVCDVGNRKFFDEYKKDALMDAVICLIIGVVVFLNPVSDPTLMVSMIPWAFFIVSAVNFRNFIHTEIPEDVPQIKSLPVQDEYFALKMQYEESYNFIPCLERVGNDKSFVRTLISKLKTVESSTDLKNWLTIVEQILDADPTFPLDSFPVVTDDLLEIRYLVIGKCDQRQRELEEEKRELKAVRLELDLKFAMEDSESAKRNAIAHIESL